MTSTTTTTTSTLFSKPRFTRIVAAIDEQYSALLQKLRQYIPHCCYDVEHMAAILQEKEAVDRLWEGEDQQVALMEDGQRMAKKAEERYQTRDDDGASKGIFGANLCWLPFSICAFINLDVMPTFFCTFNLQRDYWLIC